MVVGEAEGWAAWRRSAHDALNGQRAGWWLSLYSSAGEAGGHFQAASRPPVVHVPGVPARDPVRARAEAARRARASVRRYCAANRLTRFGTLTYGPPRCSDPRQLRQHVGGFFRTLRRSLGGAPLPYVWVPELHADRVHFHVHFALGRFVQRRLIEQAWGRGYVSIKLLSDLPVGARSWQEARRAAGYLSKYLTKAFDRELGGLHRYEVAEGFQPAVQRLSGRSAGSVLAQACEVMRAQPEARWSSADSPGWQGPPAVWFAWAG